jgi:hypothetical protein
MALTETHKNKNQIARFFEKVQITNKCWLWIATKTTRGYGHFQYQGKMRQAHRIAYEWFVGPIEDGMQLDHLCRHRACVRPGHLEIVTPQENSLRGIGPSAINARKIRCCRGHEFNAENSIFKYGERKCRICHELRMAEIRKKKQRSA